MDVTPLLANSIPHWKLALGRVSKKRKGMIKEGKIDKFLGLLQTRQLYWAQRKHIFLYGQFSVLSNFFRVTLCDRTQHLVFKTPVKIPYFGYVIFRIDAKMSVLL
jgi:hypothetical protein